MSEARTHRKAAQTSAAKVVELVKGVSGLSSAQKAQRLADALTAAKATVANLEKGVAVAPVTGNARKFRKEVQTSAAQLVAAAKGVSGLSAADKKASLQKIADLAKKANDSAQAALAAAK